MISIVDILIHLLHNTQYTLHTTVFILNQLQIKIVHSTVHTETNFTPTTHSTHSTQYTVDITQYTLNTKTYASTHIRKK